MRDWVIRMFLVSILVLAPQGQQVMGLVDWCEPEETMDCWDDPADCQMEMPLGWQSEVSELMIEQQAMSASISSAAAVPVRIASQRGGCECETGPKSRPPSRLLQPSRPGLDTQPPLSSLNTCHSDSLAWAVSSASIAIRPEHCNAGSNEYYLRYHSLRL